MMCLNVVILVSSKFSGDLLYKFLKYNHLYERGKVFYYQRKLEMQVSQKIRLSIKIQGGVFSDHILSQTKFLKNKVLLTPITG